jgi:putative membrane protein
MQDSQNLGEPRRQSPIAIVMILAQALTRVVKQVFPFVIIAFLGSSDNRGLKILTATIVITLISSVATVIKYFSTYYYIHHGSLILNSGWLSKSKVNIPLNKIQAINFEQNVLHRMLGVVKVYADTAGSDKKEFELSALTKYDAEALREFVLHHKNVKVEEIESDIAQETIIAPVSTSRIIFKLDIPSLIKVGITENHLRSGWLIIVAVFWIYSQIEEVGIKVEDEIDIESWWQTVINSMILLGLLFLTATILISLTRTVVKYFDLTFLRVDNGFKVVKGLFNRTEVAAQDSKVQYISWSQNILQKLLSYNTLSIHQAGSIGQGSSGIVIPGCLSHHIDYVRECLIPRVDLETIPMSGVDKRYVSRLATILGVSVIIILAFLVYNENFYQALGLALIYAILIVNRYYRYKKIAYGNDGENIVIFGGTWGAKKTILPIYKVQSINMIASPYMHRHGLATLRINTAAGALSIPYLSKAEAIKYSDIVLYKVETSDKWWM